MAIVTVPASLLFVRLERKIDTVLLLCGLFMTVSFSLMAFSGTTVFLVLYGISCFFQNMANVSIPVMVTKIIDGQVAGQYSGWRMVLHTCGGLIANAVFIPLLHTVGAFWTLFFAGFSQLICGIEYYVYYRNMKKIINNDLYN